MTGDIYIPKPCPVGVLEAYFDAGNDAGEASLPPGDFSACRLVIEAYGQRHSPEGKQEWLDYAAECRKREALNALRKDPASPRAPRPSPPRIRALEELKDIYRGQGYGRQTMTMGWEPLKIALLLQDGTATAALLPLADFSASDLAALRRADPAAFPFYAGMLEDCGYRLPPDLRVTGALTPEEMRALLCAAEIHRMPVDGKYADCRVGFLDEGLRALLKACREGIHPEAIAVGGGVRDAFLGAPVRNFTVFLRDFYNEDGKCIMLEKIFEKSGLDIKEQTILPGPYRDKFNVGRKESFDRLVVPCGGQGVTVVAGPCGIAYKFVFLDNLLSDVLSRDAWWAKKGRPAGEHLLSLVDVPLSQIATDGETVSHTPAFRRDIREESLSAEADMTRPNISRHLGSLLIRHPGRTLSEEARALLPAHSAARLPRERLRVLKAFQDTGSPEAVMAAGEMLALDLGEGMGGSADIFLESACDTRKNRRRMVDSFRRAGFEITADVARIGRFYDRGIGAPETRPFLIGAFAAGTMQSWSVAARAKTAPASANPTLYTVRFIEGPLADRLEIDERAPGEAVARIFLNALDVPESQIATDGRSISFTPEYTRAKEERLIDVARENDTTRERLLSHQARRRGWTLSPAAAKIAGAGALMRRQG